MSELRPYGEKLDPSFLEFLVQALRQGTLSPDSPKDLRMPPSGREDEDTYVNLHPIKAPLSERTGVRS